MFQLLFRDDTMPDSRFDTSWRVDKVPEYENEKSSTNVGLNCKYITLTLVCINNLFWMLQTCKNNYSLVIN